MLPIEAREASMIVSEKRQDKYFGRQIISTAVQVLVFKLCYVLDACE